MAFSYQPLICAGCGSGTGLKQGTGELSDSMVCSYCGYRYYIKPPEDDEKYLYFVHYENGVSELRALRFDRAAVEFREAYDLDPDRPDALWGLICAEYGIVQVKSYHDQKYNPIFCLVNYEERTPFAVNEQVRQLRSCIARMCEDYEIYRDWLADAERQIQKIMEATPKPHTWKWDVFIACKISKATERFPNADGKTPEHEEALRLHKELTERGLRVFYSEKYFVDNMGKPDSDWQIMTALLNSRQMLLVCGGVQNDEKLNTPWVRSEWMRWRSMQQQGVKREDSLIVYSISESTRSLPEGLFTGNTVYPSHRAELLRTLERNCYSKSRYKEDTKRGEECMRRSDFSGAAAVFGHIAAMRPTRAEPHVYLFLCDCRVRSLSGLEEKHLQNSPESNPHYRKAEACNARRSCELFHDLKDRIQFLRDRQKDDKMAKMQEKMEELERQLQEDRIDAKKPIEHDPKAIPSSKTQEQKKTLQEPKQEPASTSASKGGTVHTGRGESKSISQITPEEIEKIVSRIVKSFDEPKKDEQKNAGPRYSQGLSFGKLDDGTYAVTGMGTCKDTKLVIPPTTPEGGKVTSIEGFAFPRCSGLTSVTIPNSVTSIGDYAFSGCSGLTSVTIPNRVTSIGDYAFSGCSGLTSVTIPDSVTSIGDYAFSGCSGLTSITVETNNPTYYSQDNCVIERKTKCLVIGIKTSRIPDDVTSIGRSAFSFCSGLISVTIPNSVTSIGDDAFSVCNGLTSVTIPNRVTSIGDRAFYGCSGLTSVTIPNSVTSIGRSAFFGCSGLTSVTIPISVTKIGEGAFEYCSKTTICCEHPSKPADWDEKWNPDNRPVVWNYKPTTNTTTESSSITPISASGQETLRYSQGLKFAKRADGTYAVAVKGMGTCKDTELVIPPTTPEGGKVTSIGNLAFSGCSGLTSVTIPNSVTSIGYDAFSRCSGLISVTIPNSVTSIGDDAFSGCRGLTSINVEPNNPKYYSQDNCVIERETKRLAVGIQTSRIPNSVESIGNEAFYGCSGLTSVTIPNRVTSIGRSAFECCSGLTSVTIPNSVKSIGQWAFDCCSGLTSVTIPISVTKIGEGAFEYCSKTTIYCEHPSKPAGWHDSWNPDNRPVIWNYKP